jgi:dolichol-phosphate mannosyltransferase
MEPCDHLMTPESPIAPPRDADVAELAIVIPTLNECRNVAPLIERLHRVLAGVAWEAVFVDDDSTDGTLDAIHAMARRDPRVRSLHRIGRRGLASACIEGALASSAPFVAVIDADMQHDERLLPEMLRTLKSEPLDIVVGSRYVAGGGMGALSAQRVRISDFATRLSRRILRAEVADPMSGFFMIRRDAFNRAVRGLSGIGFKILMDLFASAPEPLRFKELPYEFGPRVHGDSKLDTLVVWEYVMLVGDKLVGHVIPVRFLSFALVGGSGMVVNFVALWLMNRLLGAEFATSLGVSTILAMVSNYVLNNLLTYRDLRLRGWAFLRGFLSFFLVCAAGAVANIGAGKLLYDEGFAWWVAGGIVGPLVSAVWNYAVSGVVTWRRRVKE